MRPLLSSLIWILLVASTQGQEAMPAKCELQNLAIDAALGDSVAQYNLGVEFFRGNKLSRDYAKAANLWRKASDAGEVAASNNLGFLKYYGRPGVEQDYREGIRLWRVAAEQGFAESQVHLGEAYSDGRFLQSDFVEAYAWAKAGKYHSSRVTEKLDKPNIDEAIAKMAEDVLVHVSKKLSDVEKAKAEKKAAEYIRKFAPQ